MGYFLEKAKSLINDRALPGKAEFSCEKSEFSEESRYANSDFPLDYHSELWHAETIATTVKNEGICIFWSEAFGEMIAFIRDESFRSHVPCGFVFYTSKELKELFGNGKTPLSSGSLRLIHQAKKAGGGAILSHKPRNNGGWNED